METQIILCDTNKRVTDAIEKYFGSSPLVRIVHGDIFEQGADTLVAPGNSRAYMDGGLDLAICKFFGQTIEPRIREEIARSRKDEFLPVGDTVLVRTQDIRIPYVIYAPTMERPQNIRGTDKVYRAMRAILQCIKTNQQLVKKIVIPGLGTGVGEMFPNDASDQMWAAFKEAYC